MNVMNTSYRGGVKVAKDIQKTAEELAKTDVAEAVKKVWSLSHKTGFYLTKLFFF